jgi:hypothetical protein
MTLGTPEHDDIVQMFEKSKWLHPYGTRLDKEATPGHTRQDGPDPLWKMGRIYQHGPTNQAFLAYRAGYAHGRCVYLDGGPKA